MKVKVADVKKMLEEIFAAKGADPEMVAWLTELSLEQDLTGNYFSGFEESPEGIYGDIGSTAKETYEVNKPALKLINGNGHAIKIILKDLMPKAVDWARQQGQVVIGFKNCGYHGAMGTIARKFAEQDIICVYSANGGPATVTPFGGTKELFGTNPLAYGIPASADPIVFDAATSERPFGSIKRAKDLGQPLQENTYYDKSGKFTTNPDEAMSIIPFGEHRGYAINLLLDILTGALVGAKSGSLVADESDLGGMLILIDPAAFGPVEEFKVQTDKIVQDIQSNPRAEGVSEVRVPGFRAKKYHDQQLKDGEIEVEDRIWQKFSVLHKKMVS